MFLKSFYCKITKILFQFEYHAQSIFLTTGSLSLIYYRRHFNLYTCYSLCLGCKVTYIRAVKALELQKRVQK